MADMITCGYNVLPDFMKYMMMTSLTWTTVMTMSAAEERTATSVNSDLSDVIVLCSTEMCLSDCRPAVDDHHVTV